MLHVLVVLQVGVDPLAEGSLLLVEDHVCGPHVAYKLNKYQDRTVLQSHLWPFQGEKAESAKTNVLISDLNV